MKNSLTIIGGLLVVVVLAVFLNRSPSGTQLSIITSYGTSDFVVELAQSPEEREKGLMFRKLLEVDRGMFFVYEQASNPLMWMRNMQIPLDILFIGEDLTIKHIEKSVPPCVDGDASLCARYKSNAPVKYVLELASGVADARGISLGDRITLPTLVGKAS